jgi:hypothetical protein
MAQAHFGVDTMLSMVGRDELRIVHVASQEAMYFDKDPALIAFLLADPLLCRILENGRRERQIPYDLLGPLCTATPDFLLRRIIHSSAFRDLLGNISPAMMRNYFARAAASINYHVMKELLLCSLINGRPPYLENGIPLDPRVKVVELKAKRDPWGPAEGPADIFGNLPPAERNRVAIVGISKQYLYEGIRRAKQFIADPEYYRVVIILDDDIESGHLAIVEREIIHQMIMPPLLHEARNALVAGAERQAA